MANWHDITRDPQYQSLGDADKADLKQQFFGRTIAQDPEFHGLSDDAKKATFVEFLNTPDDTGQGIVTSTLSSGVRGLGEVVPGAIEGVGALTGIEPLRQGGKSIRSGLEYVTPTNPIHQEGIPAKAASTVGQVGSVLATAGAGGILGKALSAGGKAAEAANIARGANAAVYGSAALQGATSGANEAERYGMTGVDAYLRTLAGAASEVGSEMLPFGAVAETGAIKKLLGGEMKGLAPGIRRAALQEAPEEGVNQALGNLATKVLAPVGVETPGLSEGVLEAAAYGGLGGAVMGGVNRLTGAASAIKILPPAAQNGFTEAVNNTANAADVAPLTAQALAQTLSQNGNPTGTPLSPTGDTETGSEVLPASDNLAGLSEVAEPPPQQIGAQEVVEPELAAAIAEPAITQELAPQGQASEVANLEAGSGIVTAQPEELGVLQPIQADLEQAQQHITPENAASVDLSQPVPVIRRQDGTLQLTGGHHRWLAAQLSGRPLQLDIQNEVTQPPLNSATPTLPNQGGLSTQPENGNQSGQTTEAGVSNSVLSAAPSQEEVTPSISPNGVVPTESLPSTQPTLGNVGAPFTQETPASIANRTGEGSPAASSQETATRSIAPSVDEQVAENERIASEKMEIVENAISHLDNAISKLPQNAQAKWSADVRSKARTFYETRNDADLEGLNPIQKKKVRE